ARWCLPCEDEPALRRHGNETSAGSCECLASAGLRRCQSGVLPGCRHLLSASCDFPFGVECVRSIRPSQLSRVGGRGRWSATLSGAYTITCQIRSDLCRPKQVKGKKRGQCTLKANAFKPLAAPD